MLRCAYTYSFTNLSMKISNDLEMQVLLLTNNLPNFVFTKSLYEKNSLYHDEQFTFHLFNTKVVENTRR